MALDTSCMVPLLCPWHPFHSRTLAECQRLKQQEVRFVVPVHALLECFSVLTRMPVPFRIAPEEALENLLRNFSGDTLIPGFDAEMTWATIREVAATSLGGARIYDAVIALASHRAGAKILVTWNVRDFLPVAPPGLQIREP